MQHNANLFPAEYFPLQLPHLNRLATLVLILSVFSMRLKSRRSLPFSAAVFFYTSKNDTQHYRISNKLLIYI